MQLTCVKHLNKRTVFAKISWSPLEVFGTGSMISSHVKRAIEGHGTGGEVDTISGNN